MGKNTMGESAQKSGGSIGYLIGWDIARRFAVRVTQRNDTVSDKLNENRPGNATINGHLLQPIFTALGRFPVTEIERYRRCFSFCGHALIKAHTTPIVNTARLILDILARKCYTY